MKFKSTTREFIYKHKYEDNNTIVIENHKTNQLESENAARKSLVNAEEEWYNFELVSWRFKNGLGKWKKGEI